MNIVCFHPCTTSRRAWSAILGLCAFVLGSGAPVLAGFTEVRVPSPAEASHELILEKVFGGDFVGSGIDLGYGLWTAFDNGTVQATRVDDFGLAALLDMLSGMPGSGDDDIWAETGKPIATARARFALFPQEFGYDAGSGYVKLLDVPAGTFDEPQNETAQFRPDSTWLWCRCDDSDGGLVNEQCSEEASHTDVLDHMITYHVLGVPGVPSTSAVWLVFWEDLNGNFGDNSNPDNQGFPADRDFNDLVIEIVVQQCLVDADCDQGGECTIGTCNVNNVCEYAVAPAGTLCGNPGPEGLCDNPDTCDQAGNCMPNYAPASTECRPASGFRQWDLADSQHFQMCFTGSQGPYGPDCGVFDFNSDGRVDWDDWAKFLAAWSNPSGFLEPGEGDLGSAACDLPEFCTGTSPFCPPDEFAPSTTECRASAGDCDLNESCTGVSPYCPPDALAPSMTECRAQMGDCDRSEHCTGSTSQCPPDEVAPIGTVCRGVAGVCDLAEACDGISPFCPADRVRQGDTPCPDDGSECTDDACDGVGVVCGHTDNGLCGACCQTDDTCADEMLQETCTSQGGTFAGASTQCQGDSDGDGVDDLCGPGPSIPTVSQWGIVIMVLLILTVGKISFSRRHSTWGPAGK